MPQGFPIISHTERIAFYLTCSKYTKEAEAGQAQIKRHNGRRGASIHSQNVSKEPRYYVLIEAGGKSLAEALVSQGLARTKGAIASLPTGEKSKAYVERLEALEREAQQKRLGVWANSIQTEIKTDAK